MVEIKGAVVNGSMIAVKKRSGDQVYNNIISQLDEQTRQLFEKPIANTDWFPLDYFLKFLELDIKLTANGDEHELQIRAEALNEKQIKEIYKIFVKVGSPEIIIKHHSMVHQGYFKGVSIKITFDGSNKVIIKYIGFEKQHRLMEPAIVGYYKKALEISVATDIHTKFLTSIGENKGYCELEITWKIK
jgi:hypothetical protein